MAVCVRRIISCGMTPLDESHPELPCPSSPAGADGYVTWRQQREDSVNRVGQLSGLPLNHRVEVTLRDGVRLRGRLRLREERLFLEEKFARELDLVVDGVSFRSVEIEACSRLD